MASIPDCDAVIDDNIDCINEIETALVNVYPIEYMRTNLYKLELDLTHYKQDLTAALLEQLSRSIEWNMKHSGLGFTKVKLTRKDNILNTKLRLNSNLNLHKILAFDLGLIGIKPNQIKIH